jgi:hypothetical protein
MNIQTLIIFTTLVLILTSINIVASQNHKKAYLKGALLFEQQNDKPIIINPNKLTFYRYLNFSSIWEASKLAAHFTETYNQFCETVENIYKHRITGKILKIYKNNNQYHHDYSKKIVYFQHSRLNPFVEKLSVTVINKLFKT